VAFFRLTVEATSLLSSASVCDDSCCHDLLSPVVARRNRRFYWLTSESGADVEDLSANQGSVTEALLFPRGTLLLAQGNPFSRLPRISPRLYVSAPRDHFPFPPIHPRRESRAVLPAHTHRKSESIPRI